MKRRAPLAAIAILMVVVAASGIAVLALGSGRTIHGDGDGLLASTSSAMSYVTPAGGGGAAWTIGVPVCTPSGEALTIEGVRVVDPVGVGSEYLGARALTLTDAHPGFDFAGPAFPPEGAEAAVPATGFVVDHRCDDATTKAQELLLGIRLNSQGSGGWSGVMVDYAADGKRYTLSLDLELKMCGPDLVDPSCATLPSPEASASAA